MKKNKLIVLLTLFLLLQIKPVRADFSWDWLPSIFPSVTLPYALCAGFWSVVTFASNFLLDRETHEKSSRKRVQKDQKRSDNNLNIILQQMAQSAENTCDLNKKSEKLEKKIERELAAMKKEEEKRQGKMQIAQRVANVVARIKSIYQEREFNKLIEDHKKIMYTNFMLFDELKKELTQGILNEKEKTTNFEIKTKENLAIRLEKMKFHKQKIEKEYNDIQGTIAIFNENTFTINNDVQNIQKQLQEETVECQKLEKNVVASIKLFERLKEKVKQETLKNNEEHSVPYKIRLSSSQLVQQQKARDKHHFYDSNQGLMLKEPSLLK